MKTNYVRGTQWYADVVSRFIEATTAIAFEDLHSSFLKFIPKQPGQILDIGAGIGRDAAVLSDMGYCVTAVEPMEDFRLAGMQLYKTAGIIWRDDSLPALSRLGKEQGKFDFVLASGIWHHLDHQEQLLSIQRISELLSPNGIFAVSLRHGPAGAGKHVFTIDVDQTIDNAEIFGLRTLFSARNLPSLMQHKQDVTWTKLVFTKQLK